MYILVLAEHTMAATFLSRGLKYENIQSEAKSFYDNWDDEYLLKQFDAVVCKFPSKIHLPSIQLEKIQKVPRNCPFFIVANKSTLDLLTPNISLPLYVYPESITVRALAFEIKKYLLQKQSFKNKQTLKVADLTLNLQTREVERFEQKLYLRNKEFQLLEYLMSNTDVILSRQKILENVWDRNANLFTHTVDVHINTLRKKIDYNPKMRLIETVYCIGYRMHSMSKSLN